mmetsp:Transcript_12575/g.26501  ORF Transcript_12575/g.26501 Transcript_12575/m.26501 type:complete len:128 (+) Transcript_12575:151-534(+)
MNEDRNNQDVTVGSSCYNSNSKIRGSIVVVAKCPIPGKSKTRLIPLMGEMGSVRLAKSMLSDVLKTIAGCVSLSCIVLYCVVQHYSVVFVVLQFILSCQIIPYNKCPRCFIRALEIFVSEGNNDILK